MLQKRKAHTIDHCQFRLQCSFLFYKYDVKHYTELNETILILFHHKIRPGRAQETLLCTRFIIMLTFAQRMK